MNALPSAPLLDALERAGGLDVVLSRTRRDGDPDAQRLYVTLQALRRRRSVSARTADVACVQLLGTHPASVYGRQWAALAGGARR